MPTVSLPCPSCAAPLILDEENAGQEVLCPGCEARLRLPATVSTKNPPVILTSGPLNSGKTQNPAEAGGKPLLPQGRSKSVEDERKRLAAAAAAAGGANILQPEAAQLPKDHRPAVLPTRKNQALPTDPGIAGETAAPADPSRAPVVLPSKRTAGPAPSADPSQVQIQPMEPKEDIEISAKPLTGPSKFVRNEPSGNPPGRTEPEESPDHAEPETGGQDNAGPVPRGGYRLGGGRQLHFSPAPVVESDGEATAWGAKTETDTQAARSRRFVSLAVVIALLAAGGVVFQMARQAMAQKEQLAAAADDSEDGEGGAAPSENVMENVERARVVLLRFLQSENVEQMAAEVRHPDITRPRMERFYQATPLKPRKIKSESQSWSEFRVENTEFIRGMIELDDFTVRPVSLEIIKGSDPKMDWESYVSWAEMPWKDFLRTPPEQAVEYRVTVTTDPRDQYYNYSFKGRELDMLCFKLEDPEKYGSCWAYCHKDSEAARHLIFNLRRSRQQGIVNAEGKTATSCILKLRFPPEGRKTNQVIIEQFIHNNWVMP